MSRFSFPLALALAALTVSALPAAAQDYPSQPIQLIVPYSAGGAVDFVGRTLAQSLSTELGQPVVVENRGGASGNIGTQAVATATPNGYTLLMSAVTSTTLATLMQEGSPGFDFAADFAPVAVVGEVPTVLVVNEAFSAQTVQEFLDAARGGQTISYASSGVGSVEHLGMELLAQAAEVQMVHIPYDGAAPGIADIAGGHVTAMIATVPTAIPQIEGGRVRPLMIASGEKLDSLPDVPTAADAGFENVNVASLYAVLAPKDVDPAIIEKLNGALAGITSSESYRTTMAERGIVPVSATLAEAQARFDEELGKWGEVVERMNQTDQ